MCRWLESSAKLPKNTSSIRVPASFCPFTLAILHYSPITPYCRVRRQDHGREPYVFRPGVINVNYHSRVASGFVDRDGNAVGWLTGTFVSFNFQVEMYVSLLHIAAIIVWFSIGCDGPVIISDGVPLGFGEFNSLCGL